VFFFWPAGQALLQSLQQEDAFGTTEWVGLDNFRRSGTTPPIWLLPDHGAVLGAGGGAGPVAAGGVCRPRRARRLVYKTLLICPTPWRRWWRACCGVHVLALHRRGAYCLRQLGFDWNHLLNDRHAMALIVMAAVWKQISYNFLFFLAGLQSIPKSLIEAAAIDGAGPGGASGPSSSRCSPTTFFLLVINIVYAFFDTFAIIDATTQGGPGKDTSILVYKVYHDGFKALDLGGSAAQSVVLMVIVIVLTVSSSATSRKRCSTDARSSARPGLPWFAPPAAAAHLVMIAGVLIVAFPIYLAFVASTHTAPEIMQAPMPLWPGQPVGQLRGGAARLGRARPPPRWRA
jgi:sn-glycerol 3-phosphate transport system permease protein